MNTNLEAEPFDTSTNFADFRDDVFETVEHSDLSDYYPPALFAVNRESEGFMLDIEDLSDENPEYDVDWIVNELVPEIIKNTNSKIFAIILPATQKSKSGSDVNIVMLAIGDFMHTEMYVSAVSRLDGRIKLDGWHEQDVTDYIDIIKPFRRAITLQG